MEQDELACTAGRPRRWPHYVRWEPSSPSQRGTAPAIFAHIYCGQMAGVAGWIKMPLGMKVGLGPGDFASDPAPPPQEGVRAHKFSAHFYCGQTAGYIKMPLGTEVDLSPGHIVLDGDPCSSPPQKGGTAPTSTPNFRSMSIVPKQLDGSRCHLV